MTLADSGVTLHDLLLWGFGSLGVGGGVLALRARNSVDGTQRAKDAAEKGVYSGALADMTTDRNGWRDAYRDLEKLYRESEVKNGRNETRIEAQAIEIEHLSEQVNSLRLMVGRFADADMRRKLGPDFARSQAGGLDDLGDSTTSDASLVRTTKTRRVSDEHEP